jgi:hypothetical protein
MGGYERATRKAPDSEGIRIPCQPASKIITISVLEKRNG